MFEQSSLQKGGPALQSVGRGGLLHNVRTALAVVRKEWIVFVRYPTWVVGSFIWPALFPAIYVFLAKALSGPGGQAVAVFNSYSGTTDYVGFILFGTTLWMILNMTLWNLGSHLRQEQIRGTLEATWTTPASRTSLLFGASTLQFLQSMLFLITTLLTVRLVYGFQLHGNALLLAGLLVLSLLPVIGLGILFASLVVWFKETNSMVFLVRGIFMVFAGMTYPVEVLPGWMQAISAALPLTYAIRSMRAVGLAGAGWADVRSDALALGVFSVIFLAIGLISFRIVERQGQRAGTLGHY